MTPSIYQFDRVPGVVQRVTEDSQQLADAPLRKATDGLST
jgi:hypothetical protein